MRAIAAQRLPARREVRRRHVVRPARQARAASSTPPRTRSSYVPPWYGERMLELGEQRAARIGLAGPVAPGPARRPRPARAGRDRLPARQGDRPGRQRAHDQLDDRAGPTPALGRAGASRPRPERGAAPSCGEQILHVLRLDEADPVAAWRSAPTRSSATAERLTERRFDALHYEGPGTDLTVGLLPELALDGGALRDRRRHRAHAEPADRGDLHHARPGSASTGTCARRSRSCCRRHGRPRPRGSFEGGRAVAHRRRRGRGRRCARYAARDEGAARLGEVALVDREGRIGALGHGLLRHAARRERGQPHRARPAPTRSRVGEDDRDARRTDSEIHIDFMIGSPDVDVTGITADGDRVPVLRGGAWQI